MIASCMVLVVGYNFPILVKILTKIFQIIVKAVVIVIVIGFFS